MVLHIIRVYISFYLFLKREKLFYNSTFVVYIIPYFGIDLVYVARSGRERSLFLEKSRYKLPSSYPRISQSSRRAYGTEEYFSYPFSTELSVVFLTNELNVFLNLEKPKKLFAFKIEKLNF